MHDARCTMRDAWCHSPDTRMHAHLGRHPMTGSAIFMHWPCRPRWIITSPSRLWWGMADGSRLERGDKSNGKDAEPPLALWGGSMEEALEAPL